MTEEELLIAFRAVIYGERQRIQRMALKQTHRQMLNETYGVRKLFTLIHPDGESVVDHWIREVKNGN